MAGIEFSNKPYDMVEEYEYLCNGGGMVVPLNMGQEELNLLEWIAEVKGLTLVDYLNSVAPAIEEKIMELCQDVL